MYVLYGVRVCVKKYEVVHFLYLYIYIIYIKCECVCTVGGCIFRPIRSLYKRTSHYVFFPPCGALKTSSLNFFYSSSSFRFYIIHIYIYIYHISFLFSSIRVIPPLPPTPSYPSPILCHFYNSKQKLMHVLYIMTHPIVIPRYCSVLPA